MASVAELLIILAVVLFFGFGPFALWVKQRQTNREREHKERMKALEMGLPTPARAAGAGSVMAIGAGVPIASMFMACAATVVVLSNAEELQSLSSPHGPYSNLSVPLLGIIWISAVTVRSFALLIALILGIVQARSLRNGLQANAWGGGHAKPVFDPHSYEFAGH